MKEFTISVSHSTYSGGNAVRLCFSKAQAVRVLRARGILRDIARQVVNIVTAEPSGCVTTRCGCNLIKVANVDWALAQGHYGHSREELRKLWSKFPEH